MSREWKPGDDIGPVVIDWNGTAFATLIRVLDSHYKPGHKSLWDAIHRANSPSPLVVVDPEDHDQVAVLMGLFSRECGDLFGADGVRFMQAALREFANPTPPRPDEPTGLGAVVEDATGNRWVLYTSTDSTAPWCDGATSWEWDDIAVVRVLSEGV